MERCLFPTTWTGQAMGGVMPDLHSYEKPKETSEPQFEAAALVPLPCVIGAASRTS